MFRSKFIAGFIAVMFISACAEAQTIDERTMRKPAALMTTLAEKFTTFQPECVGGDNSDIPQSFVDEALNDNRNIKADLEGYSIKARWSNCRSILLLCTKDGTRGLLEEAGCDNSAARAPGERLWQTNPEAPCDFTLTVDAACNVVP